MEMEDVIEYLETIEMNHNTEVKNLWAQIHTLQFDKAELRKKLDAAMDKKPVNDAVHKSLEPVYQELELWFKKYEEAD